MGVGLNLDDAGEGLNTWGNLIAAIEYGPQDSAYNVAKNGDVAWWTPSLELLAQATERLDLLLWQGAGSPTGKRPKPIERPGRKSRTERYGQGESWTASSLDEWITLMEATQT